MSQRLLHFLLELQNPRGPTYESTSENKSDHLIICYNINMHVQFQINSQDAENCFTTSYNRQLVSQFPLHVNVNLYIKKCLFSLYFNHRITLQRYQKEENNVTYQK